MSRELLDRERQTVIDQVFAWRMHSFIGMGFDAEMAEALALLDQIDLHEMRKLLSRGCPPKLAAEILL